MSAGVGVLYQGSHGDLENESGHGKVMEQEKLAKGHGILLSVMEFYQFCSQIVPNLYVICHHLCE